MLFPLHSLKRMGFISSMQCSRSIELIGERIFLRIISSISKGQNFPLLTFCLLLIMHEGNCNKPFDRFISLNKEFWVILQHGVVSPAGMAKEI
jgi:hypothetical protein